MVPMVMLGAEGGADAASHCWCNCRRCRYPDAPPPLISFPYSKASRPSLHLRAGRDASFLCRGNSLSQRWLM